MNEKKLQDTSSQEPERSAPEEEDSRPQHSRGSDATNAFRTLAAFYLCYLVYQLVKEISAGTVSGRALPFIIGAIVLFCAGAVWLVWPGIRRIKEALDADEPR